MTPTEPLSLYHSWPLYDLAQRFDLGRLHERADTRASGQRGDRTTGRWDCDLADNRLHWSPEVHDLFGFTRDDASPTREATVALYDESSRAAMERLRHHAIRHNRGFTLDIRVTPIRAPRRWLRLIAAPVSAGGRVVRLHGSKTDVSHLYPRG